MRSRVILHSALSLDGRLTRFPVDLRIYYELAARWEEDITLAGCDTLLAGLSETEIEPEDASAFEPKPPDPDDQRPLLAVPDSRGRLRAWHYLKKQPYWRGMIALCSESTPREYLHHLEERHIQTVIAGGDHVDLAQALQELSSRFQARVIRVDSGGTLNGLLLRAGLVDEISVLLHPALVGTAGSVPFLLTPEDEPLGESISLETRHIEELDNGLVWLRFDVKR
jgi:2,5-diamino-6-(ribosylamino)-4(3H)-pyrimidinone 5'-phosphate reductase